MIIDNAKKNTFLEYRRQLRLLCFLKSIAAISSSTVINLHGSNSPKLTSAFIFVKQVTLFGTILDNDGFLGIRAKKYPYVNLSVFFNGDGFQQTSADIEYVDDTGPGVDETIADPQASRR
jgi:hypothetical protein